MSAETIPAETEKPWPSGLPIAITQSPTRMARLSPKGTALSGSTGSTLSSAMSVVGSVPTTSASSSKPSKNSTTISSAFSMTWLLVTT